MRLEQPWLVPDNPRPRQPTEGNIVAGIHLHNPISSLGQWCQDALVETVQFQPQNAILPQCFWHLLGDIGSARGGSRRAFSVSSIFLIKYYQTWDTVARHADRSKKLSSECCRMLKWQAQLFLRREVDPVYPTTSHPCSSRCRFDDSQSQQGAPVQNRGVPEIGDVLEGTEYIWKYPCSITFRRYVSRLQSKYPRRVRNRVQRGAFARHLLIGMIRFWSCPVHA